MICNKKQPGKFSGLFFIRGLVSGVLPEANIGCSLEAIPINVGYNMAAIKGPKTSRAIG